MAQSHQNASPSPFAHTPDWRVAVAILAAVAGLCVTGFLMLAEGVGSGAIDRFDERLLLAMRNTEDLGDPIGPRWVEEAMRDFTALGGVVISTLVTAGAVALLALKRKASMAIFLALAVATGVTLCLFLKSAYDRPRPQLAPHGSHVYTKSFPSGHTMTAATAYLTLGVMLARVQRRRSVKWFLVASAVAVTLLVGLSRVYLAVHWPSDVLAGWALGAAWASLCWIAALLITRQLHRSRGRRASRMAEEMTDAPAPDEPTIEPVAGRPSGSALEAAQ
ncbi:phosphatase PAP2 family protein [Botrimarina sp.]|uniref:phosphatase PAP2 family protein n=1 Tax=Botrimarina sp. TaxID=2795802 RepID=UPI0032F009F4